MPDNHILIADDEPLTRQSLYEILKLEGYKVSVANDGKEALDLILRLSPQIVIADLKMPRLDGLGLLKEIKSRGLDLAVILVTAFSSVDTAVEAMKSGAFDYITKPIMDGEIKIIIERIFNQRRLIEENKLLKERLSASSRDHFYQMIGRNIKMQKIYNLIETISDTNASVLLYGESGTGKMMIAQAIHNCDSKRGSGPFVEVSCGALPETLLESELFGHVRGSFTSAVRDRMGRFELADGGTIFLYEIDAFMPSLQVKLLRVIQNCEFERVGDTKTLKVDVRIIAATNQDLHEAIKRGAFREDLYYRLNVISIHIPPLRERKDDIPLLLEHFLNKCVQRSGKNKNINGISKEAQQLFMDYDWPGNVRELENAVERAVILCKGDTIAAEDLPDGLLKKAGRHPDASGRFSAQAPAGGSQGGQLKEALEAPESQIIRRALEGVNWNRKEAAKGLGINRTTLYNKMKKYGLLDKKEKSAQRA
jgi:DNA-binding NtrC family response regulator